MLYMLYRACFFRMYGEITPELSRVDYRPYRRSNHALSYLYNDIPCRSCTLRGALCSRVGYMYLGTVLQFNVVCHWYQFYMRNWKEYKPEGSIQNQGILHCVNGRWRPKSYPAGRWSNLTNTKRNMLTDIRGIQALQGDMLLSPSCEIGYFSLPGVYYNRCMFFAWISVGGVYSHDSKANAYMTSWSRN